jgi:hypothetical protein
MPKLLNVRGATEKDLNAGQLPPQLLDELASTMTHVDESPSIEKG